MTFAVAGRLLVAIAAMSATPLAAQSSDSLASRLPAYRLRLVGVYDIRTGEPLEGADIIDVLTGTSVKSSSTGTATLAFLPDGGSLVRIRKLGYELTTLPVSISPVDTLPVTILLARVVELTAMTIVDLAPRYRFPTLRSFEERRRSAATGQFIPEAAIRKEEGRFIGSFLRAHLPNAPIRDLNGTVTVGLSPRCGVGEPPAVYLDGTYLGPGVNLASYPLTTLAAIEYYATSGTAPAQFAGTLKSCGALLLWSREK